MVTRDNDIIIVSQLKAQCAQMVTTAARLQHVREAARTFGDQHIDSELQAQVQRLAKKIRTLVPHGLSVGPTPSPPRVKALPAGPAGPLAAEERPCQHPGCIVGRPS